MEKEKSLISKENEYRKKFSIAIKNLFLKEKELFDIISQCVSIEISIKKFYKEYYLSNLGEYIIKLEGLKNKIFGIEDKNSLKQEECKEEKNITLQDMEKIKKIYRKLVKIYHPDKNNKFNEEFLNIRMSEINEAFKKKDLKELLRLFKKAEIEMGIGDYSLIDRIKYIEEDIFIISKMIEIYKDKKKNLCDNEIYKLMIKKPSEREIIINEIKQKLISEIDMYSNIYLRMSGIK